MINVVVSNAIAHPSLYEYSTFLNAQPHCFSESGLQFNNLLKKHIWTYSYVTDEEIWKAEGGEVRSRSEINKIYHDKEDSDYYIHTQTLQ